MVKHITQIFFGSWGISSQSFDKSFDTINVCPSSLCFSDQQRNFVIIVGVDTMPCDVIHAQNMLATKLH